MGATPAMAAYSVRRNAGIPHSVSLTRLFYLVVLPLPLVDSLNGFLNGGANDGGLSLGILYRLLVILVCFYVMLQGVISKRSLALFCGVTILLVVPHLLDCFTMSGFPALLLKTLLPLFLIEAYRKLLDLGDASDVPARLFSVWSVAFPLTVLVPFVLGIGFQTYGSGSVGYKGFYYAQNDVCIVFVILLFFCMMRLTERVSSSRLVLLAMNASCILLLGMKSGYILMATTMLYFIFVSRRMSFAKRAMLALLVLAGAFLLVTMFSNVLSGIINRWFYFSSVTESTAEFFTSGRLERIPTAFNALMAEGSPLWWLFGSGLAYSKSLSPFGYVEMDLFDLFFQFGFVGAAFLFTYYIQFALIRVDGRLSSLRIAVVVALVMSTLAGHMLNTALSGMFFATLCCFILASREERFIRSTGEGGNDAGR